MILGQAYKTRFECCCSGGGCVPSLCQNQQMVAVASVSVISSTQGLACEALWSVRASGVIAALLVV